MPTLKTILVPVDYSPRCAWAVRYAKQFAGLFGSELTVLHVGDSSDISKLDAFLAGDLGDAPFSRSVLCGDPADQIVSFARREAVDLIFMPTRAHGRFRRFLLGSVTAKVLDDADCPVWTGVHQEEEPQPARAIFHHIVCGVDAEPNCIPLIRWSQELSTALKANLTIVHAIPAADETSDNRGEIELRRYLFHRAEERFARLRQDSGIEASVALAGGDVACVLREAALRTHAELVVIGRGHAQRALGRLRTQTYNIIRQSPCPVVSV